MYVNTHESPIGNQASYQGTYLWMHSYFYKGVGTHFLNEQSSCRLNNDQQYIINCMPIYCPCLFVSDEL